MKFKVEFDCSDSTFSKYEDSLGEECTYILLGLARLVREGFVEGEVTNTQGQRVGYWSLK